MAPSYPNQCATTANYVTGGTITVQPNWANTTASTQWIISSGTGTDSWTREPDPGERLDLVNGKLVVPKGRDLQLPDGTILHIDDLGNVRIDDSQAKVIYAANRMREFNPFVNASDLLASFIRDVGKLGVKKEELSQLPIPLLINWLVVKAAEQDNDPLPVGITPVEQHPALLRLMPKVAA